jgi:hypothetical protein
MLTRENLCDGLCCRFCYPAKPMPCSCGHQVTVASGISAPDALVSSFVAPLSVYLNGNGIMTVRRVL